MTRIKSIMKSRMLLYIILFLFSVFLASCSSDYDYDLYARFIVAENFFDKGVFNYQDYLSYTPTHLWFDHEYGASLIYYLFYRWFGNFGLVLIQGILMFFTGFWIIKTQQIQKHPYPILILPVSIFLVLFMHQNPSLVRCHMFSFMFFAMFLYFLEKTRIWNLKNKKCNILWLVPPLVILWNNIHGGVVAGMGMIFIYMLGALITGQNWSKYMEVLIISTPLLIINPYGASYINFLISANTKTRNMITEWWHVFVPRHVAYYYPLFFVGLFGIFVAFINFLDKRKLNLIKFIALCMTLYLGTIHVKLLSLPLITFFALYYNETMRLFDAKVLKRLNIIVWAVIIISVFCIPLKHPNIAKTDFNKFPVQEVEFIKINDIKGNILTEFGLGSYVSYKLYPDNLIYMDGRYEEVYYDREFDNLMNFERLDNDWEKVLRDYPTEILLIQKIIPVYSTLEKLPDWVKIYEGKLCGVFIKKKILKQNYKLPSDDIEYYRQNEFVNKGYFGKETGQNND